MLYYHTLLPFARDLPVCRRDPDGSMLQYTDTPYPCTAAGSSTLLRVPRIPVCSRIPRTPAFLALCLTDFLLCTPALDTPLRLGILVPTPNPDAYLAAFLPQAMHRDIVRFFRTEPVPLPRRSAISLPEAGYSGRPAPLHM